MSYSDFPGIQYVYVERIFRPAEMASGEEDWSATMEFCILFTTTEAIKNCNTDEDERINLGKCNLRKLLDANGNNFGD